MTAPTRRILVVGPSWVGDMVMSQSLYRELKKNNPACEIDVLAPAASRPILARMPEVRRAIDMPLGHGALGIGERRRLGHSLRAQKYDQAILLPNSLKSALVPFFAGIPKRTGWRGEMRYLLLNDLRVLDETAYPLMVQQFVALALPKNAPVPARWLNPQLVVDATNREAALDRCGLAVRRPAIALCPGAEFGPAKRWPENHYATVAQHFAERGYDIWLFGSKKDLPVCEQIVASQPQALQAHFQILAGKTSLADAIDLLSLADCVVSNDSGLMHVAAALGRNVVVVYGSTSPKFTPPLGDNVRILQIPVECGPCFQRECPLPNADEKLHCLRDLKPQRVIAAVDELLPAVVELR
jgi:heptosyltransferase-2